MAMLDYAVRPSIIYNDLDPRFATDVETRRFENLHTQEGAHLHTYTHGHHTHPFLSIRTALALA